MKHISNGVSLGVVHGSIHRAGTDSSAHLTPTLSQTSSEPLSLLLGRSQTSCGKGKEQLKNWSLPSHEGKRGPHWRSGYPKGSFLGEKEVPQFLTLSHRYMVQIRWPPMLCLGLAVDPMWYLDEWKSLPDRSGFLSPKLQLPPQKKEARVHENALC